MCVLLDPKLFVSRGYLYTYISYKYYTISPLYLFSLNHVKPLAIDLRTGIVCIAIVELHNGYLLM